MHDKKHEKYRGPVPVVVALIMKPMAAIIAALATKGPRTLKRSDSQHQSMMKKNVHRYGGAERPFDVASSNEPISEMMVGKKSGSDAKQTLLAIASMFEKSDSYT